jgi:molybdenum cofactor cytidylyltransferase
MIAAVLPAAGLSLRMGRPKLVLPWGDGQTVIGQMVQTLYAGGAQPILVITGSERAIVEAAVSGLPARCLYNPGFSQGEMLASIKLGLQALEAGAAEAAMLAPADLPWLQAETVRQLARAWERATLPILIPSWAQRSGHPVVVARSCWPEILALKRGETLRDFLEANAARIAYLEVDDPGIRRDLDTPGDYSRS